MIAHGEYRNKWCGWRMAVLGARADIMASAAEHRVDEVSLDFAAFRELFETEDRGALSKEATA